jgi:hypothetical protein
MQTIASYFNTLSSEAQLSVHQDPIQAAPVQEKITPTEGALRAAIESHIESFLNSFTLHCAKIGKFTPPTAPKPTARQLAKMIRESHPTWKLGTKRVSSTMRKMENDDYLENTSSMPVNVQMVDSPLHVKNIVQSRLRKRALKALPKKVSRTPLRETQRKQIPEDTDDEYVPSPDKSVDESEDIDSDNAADWNDIEIPLNPGVLSEEVITPSIKKKKKKSRGSTAKKNAKRRLAMKKETASESHEEYKDCFMPREISIEMLHSPKKEMAIPAEEEFILEYNYDDIVEEIMV